MIESRTLTVGSGGSVHPFSAPGAPCNGRLLLVDDDQCSLSLWGRIFEAAGYAVTLCTDAHGALLYDMRLFDLAVLDFDMPGYDGRELLLEMRARQARCPILLHSGSVDSLPAATRILFSRCVLKPTGFDEFLAIVASFLAGTAQPDPC